MDDDKLTLKLTFDDILLWNVESLCIHQKNYLFDRACITQTLRLRVCKMCAAPRRVMHIYATRTGVLCSYQFFHTIAAPDMTFIFRDL